MPADRPPPPAAVPCHPRPDAADRARPIAAAVVLLAAVLAWPAVRPVAAQPVADPSLPASAVAADGPAAATDASLPAVSPPPAPLADPVPVLRRAFHSFCPFAVDQPSVTLLSTDADWRAALDRSPIQPPPYAPGDLDTARQRLLIVAGPATPGPTATMALANGSRAVAYGPGSGRLSARVVFSDPAPAPGTLVAAVVGQPCLVLWIDLRRPVREVVARTTDGRVLGQRRLP